MSLRAPWLATLVLAIAAPPCWSQKPVYRCEQGGRITYMDSPCKAGVEIPAADPRTDTERRAAQDLVRQEQRMAERMARERRATEAAAARQAAGPGHIRHSAAEAAASAVPSDDAKRQAARKAAKPIKKHPAPAPGAPLQR